MGAITLLEDCPLPLEPILILVTKEQPPHGYFFKKKSAFCVLAAKILTPDSLYGSQDFRSWYIEFLAHLCNDTGVYLSGGGISQWRAEVLWEVLYKPLVFHNTLDGDALDWIHLPGKATQRVNQANTAD